MTIASLSQSNVATSKMDRHFLPNQIRLLPVFSGSMYSHGEDGQIFVDFLAISSLYLPMVARDETKI